MKIGVFGGAFNPVHNGHITLMNSYLDALGLDRILIIPTANPPHKTDEYLASEEDRFNMLSLVFADNPKIEISDIEFKREGKSYTYLTLLELKKLYPNDDFYLIVGSDQYLAFHSWYRADDILNMVTLCTMARSNGDYEKLIKYKSEHKNMSASIVSDFDIFEVSSTDVRRRIKENESVDGLIPKAVENYIKEHGLYV